MGREFSQCHFLAHSLALSGSVMKAGCSVGREFFQVEDCAVEVGGGFRPPDGVSCNRGSGPGGLAGAFLSCSEGRGLWVGSWPRLLSSAIIRPHPQQPAGQLA